jgi:hypothetical protein
MMLYEIDVTNCSYWAIQALVSDSTLKILTVGDSVNSGSSVVTCHRFHKRFLLRRNFL